MALNGVCDTYVRMWLYMNQSHSCVYDWLVGYLIENDFGVI